ncbi:hypothetical protein LCGC14_2800530, partial [marine sediment metagenome]
FLIHCSKQGYPLSSLKKIAWVLLSVSNKLDVAHSERISRSAVEYAVDHRARVYKQPVLKTQSRKSRLYLIHVVTEWLRFSGAMEELQERRNPVTDNIQSYIKFMRYERGLSPATISFRQSQVTHFLKSLKYARSLKAISIHDVDTYLASRGRHGWSRRSLHTLSDALRSFFRYAESRAWTHGIASAINSPHIYEQEGLPLGPTWKEVKQVVDSFSSSRTSDIRDKAIVLLLAIYGLRAGEVRNPSCNSAQATMHPALSIGS